MARHIAETGIGNNMFRNALEVSADPKELAVDMSLPILSAMGYAGDPKVSS